MRRRSKDPKKSQEVFLFALEALQPVFPPELDVFKHKKIHFGAIAGVHDEVTVDIETAQLLMKKPGLITAQAVSALANNQGKSSVLTKQMLTDMVELMKNAPPHKFNFAVPPDLVETAKELMDYVEADTAATKSLSESAEWEDYSNLSSLDV